MMLSRLPVEILEHIFTFCDDPSRVALRHTCTALKRTTHDTRLKISDFLTTAKMTRFAVSIGCTLTAKTFEMAAKHSSLSVLKTLRRLGCVRSYKVSRRLVVREDVRVLRWMEKEKFAWDVLCCALLSESDDADVERWLAETKRCKCHGVFHEKLKLT